MPTPFGLSAPAAFDADTEIPDVGDKIELTDGSARTWFLTRLDTNGDADALDPATYQNAGVSDFTEGTVASAALTRIPVTPVSVTGTSAVIDLTNAEVGDTLYLFLAKRGGNQGSNVTPNTVEGASTTLVDRTSTTVSVAKVGVWKVTVNGDMAGNPAAVVALTFSGGNDSRLFPYIVKGTVTTETVTKNQSTSAAGPFDLSVATGANGLVFGCVSVVTATAGGSSFTAGLTEDAEAAIGSDLVAAGSNEGTTAETRTITYTRDGTTSFGAWLSLALS